MATVTGGDERRGEEEQVSAEGHSGGRVDKGKTGHRGKAAAGMHRIRLGMSFLFFCGLGHVWDERGKYHRVRESRGSEVKM